MFFGEKKKSEQENEPDEDSETGKDEEDAQEGLWAARMRRLRAASGLLGVYAAWAVLSFFTCAHSCRKRVLFLTRLRIVVYGMIIYRNLSPAAAQSFASTWGISQALDLAQQWKGILREALKTTLIVAAVEWLRLSSNIQWFEEYVDFMSVQATLLSGEQTTIFAQTRKMVKFMSRVSG
jgi:hypothetical protein